MKEFVSEKNPYIKKETDKTFHYFIFSLIFCIGYRLIKEGAIPYWTGNASFYEMFLPALLVLSTILLSYGCYYIGEHYIKSEYEEEECLIDGILLGLLLPIHTPVFIIIMSVFMTVIIGRYFYNGKPFFAPVLVGIVSAVGFSIWISICNIDASYHTLLFEYTELLNVEDLMHYDIWTSFIGAWVSKTNPILCVTLFSFLIFKRVIKWKIPVFFIIFYLLLLLFSNFFIPTSITEIIKLFDSNNLLFIIVFIATDQRTTPVTGIGQFLFALLLAFFTFIGSHFWNPFLAVILSILLLNLFVPLLDYFGNYCQLKYRKNIYIS